MPDLSMFAITTRWPPSHPDRLQLYALGTPNGVKIPVALEELAIPYEAHHVSFSTNDQNTPEFLSLNPNNKIPAILDPNGPGGPVALFESGAILTYLAERSGRLLGDSPADRYRALQWLFFQVGGVGPMFGQLGFFGKYAGSTWEDKRPRDRYLAETRRLLGVLEQHLQHNTWMIGDSFSIADISIFPWVAALSQHYGFDDLIGMDAYPSVIAARDRFLARPAVQRGLAVYG